MTDLCRPIAYERRPMDKAPATDGIYAAKSKYGDEVANIHFSKGEWTGIPFGMRLKDFEFYWSHG